MPNFSLNGRIMSAAHYQYEENVLLKRNLNEKELKDVVQKYGDPDDYYQE